MYCGLVVSNGVVDLDENGFRLALDLTSLVLRRLSTVGTPHRKKAMDRMTLIVKMQLPSGTWHLTFWVPLTMKIILVGTAWVVKMEILHQFSHQLLSNKMIQQVILTSEIKLITNCESEKRRILNCTPY